MKVYICMNYAILHTTSRLSFLHCTILLHIHRCLVSTTHCIIKFLVNPLYFFLHLHCYCVQRKLILIKLRTQRKGDRLSP